jgi:hypothetical protein
VAHFTIKATVVVDVELTIMTTSEEAAEIMLKDHLCMTATLVDFDEANFDVSEDSIAGIEVSSIKKEPE